ncbi:hypothetical protein [Streptomyces sp. NPDC054863]
MLTTTDEAADFTALSARLTGFDAECLRATGLVEVYAAVAVEQLGADLFERLLRGRDRAIAGPDGDRRDAARAVTYLWYTGSWPGPPSFVVSPRSYAQGLVWRSAGVIAPATAPAGYGSWAERPSGAGVR